MRVGLVCPYDMDAPGGVQQLVTELAGQLRASGEEVVLVGAGAPVALDRREPDQAIIRAGTPFRLRGNKSTVPLTLAPTSWRRVGAALGDVDVVNIHEPLIPLVGWAALATAKPTVVTFHADVPGWVERLYRLAPLLGRRMRSATLTAVSKTAARAVPPSWGEVSIVPNAIDVDSYDLPVERLPHRIAFLGRDDPRKGLDVLLEAWPSIQRSRPAAELVVMGADRGGPLAGVTYLGPVSGDEKRRVLASSAIYVAPNLGGESFGIVIAEAMAAGCAVVASDLAAFREVLDDCGRVVPPGDHEALAREVSALLGDGDEVRRLGESGRRRVAMFDWPRAVGRYRAAYEEALR